MKKDFCVCIFAIIIYHSYAKPIFGKNSASPAGLHNITLLTNNVSKTGVRLPAAVSSFNRSSKAPVLFKQYFNILSNWTNNRTEVSTEDKLEYVFNPKWIQSKQLSFKVRASHDAPIAPTSEPAESDSMLEIFIGARNNTKFVIRNRTKLDVTENETPDAVGAGEFGANGAWAIADAPSNISGNSTAVWVAASNSEIPADATVGGPDVGEFYIGRAQLEDAVFPGQVAKSHGVCYIPWRDVKNLKSEALFGANGLFVPGTGSEIPTEVLPAEVTEEGEPLFMGRATQEGAVPIRKVLPSHGICYISYGGEELNYVDYEIYIFN